MGGMPNEHFSQPGTHLSLCVPVRRLPKDRCVPVRPIPEGPALTGTIRGHAMRRAARHGTARLGDSFRCARPLGGALPDAPALGHDLGDLALGDPFGAPGEGLRCGAAGGHARVHEAEGHEEGDVSEVGACGLAHCSFLCGGGLPLMRVGQVRQCRSATGGQ